MKNIVDIIKQKEDNKAMNKGRPINTKAVLEVYRYRKMGLGTNEIARLMKKNVRQIKRWDSYIDSKKVKVPA